MAVVDRGVLLAVIAATVMLSACTPRYPTQMVLSGSCQLNECECVDTDVAFWQAPLRADILWRQNGDAYCPPNYELRPIEK